MTLDPAVQVLLRAGLALLFASAAWQKLRAPDAFAAALEHYRLLPRTAVAPAAAALLAVESALAAALAWPGVPAAAPGSAAALLLSVYGAAIAVNLARGRRDLDCGCSGPARRQPIRPWLIARNGLLACGAASLALPASPRPLHWVDAVTLAGGVAALALLWQATHVLLADAPGLARPPSAAGGGEHG